MLSEEVVSFFEKIRFSFKKSNSKKGSPVFPFGCLIPSSSSDDSSCRRL